MNYVIPQPYSADLSAIAALSGDGFLSRAGGDWLLLPSLQKSNLPASVAYEDEANVWTQNQTFNGAALFVSPITLSASGRGFIDATVNARVRIGNVFTSLMIGSTGSYLTSGNYFGWSASIQGNNETMVSGVFGNSTNVVVCAPSGLQVRNLANSADSPISAGAATFSASALTYRNLGYSQLQTASNDSLAPGLLMEQNGRIAGLTYFLGEVLFYNRPTTGNVTATDLAIRIDQSRNVFIGNGTTNGNLTAGAITASSNSIINGSMRIGAGGGFNPPVMIGGGIQGWSTELFTRTDQQAELHGYWGLVLSSSVGGTVRVRANNGLVVQNYAGNAFTALSAGAITANNLGTGASDFAEFRLVNNTANPGQLILTGPSYSAGSAVLGARTMGLYHGGSGGLSIIADGGPIRLCRDFNTSVLTIDNASGSTFAGTVGLGGDTRFNRPSTKTLATQVFESSLSAWQETERSQASPSGALWAVFGATPIGRQTLPAAATDAATTQSLANAIRQLLIDFGFSN